MGADQEPIKSNPQGIPLSDMSTSINFDRKFEQQIQEAVENLTTLARIAENELDSPETQISKQAELFKLAVVALRQFQEYLANRHDNNKLQADVALSLAGNACWLMSKYTSGDCFSAVPPDDTTLVQHTIKSYEPGIEHLSKSDYVNSNCISYSLRLAQKEALLAGDVSTIQYKI